MQRLVFLFSTNNFIVSFFLPGGVGGVEVEEQRRRGVGTFEQS